jgi:hypothetical protein
VVMFESRVLRKIFGTEKSKMSGEWTNLHNE